MNDTILFLDKNLPPAEIEELVLTLGKHKNVKPVAVIPITSGFEDFPLSLSFLL